MKWGLIAILFISSLATTSFAAERKLSVKPSCAGQAEPNFFHLDQSGMEDVEMSLQETKHGPEIQVGPDVRFFFKPTKQSPDGSTKPGEGGFCVIAKDPKPFCSDPSNCTAKPNQPMCGGGLKKEKKGSAGDQYADGWHDRNQIIVSVGGKNVTFQLRERIEGGKVVESILNVFSSGGANRLMVRAEGQNTGSQARVKMKVDGTKDGRTVGSTVSHVQGSVKDSQSVGDDKFVFNSCQNLLKKGKAGVKSYEPPKYTKDLIGDCHPVGAQEGLQSEYNSKVCSEDLGSHASYTGNSSKGTPARRVTAAGFQ